MFWNFIIRERFGARPDALAIDGGTSKRSRGAACGNENVLRLQLKTLGPIFNRDQPWPVNSPMAKISCDFVLLEEDINPACESGHNLLLSPQHRGQIQRHL